MLCHWHALQDAHVIMLHKDMSKLDLKLLDMKLQLTEGDTYKGSDKQVYYITAFCCNAARSCVSV